MREIYGTLIGRWYVTIFGAVFLWQSSRRLGWRKTGLYVLVALPVGIVFENASVHFGIPYTRYTFNSHLRSKELFVGSVPLMVPLSYTFLGYFGWAAGRMLASGPWRTRGKRVWHEMLLGMILMVWAIWLVDPVSRLGQRYFLGRLFHYTGPGFWFGLPLGSQVGFGLTALILVGFLTWLGRADPDLPVTDWKQHPQLIGLMTYHGELIMMAGVAFYLNATTLGGSAVLMWVPIAAMTAVHWSASRPAPVADRDDRSAVTSFSP
jgi:uncharacterized membrane protein